MYFFLLLLQFVRFNNPTGPGNETQHRVHGAFSNFTALSNNGLLERCHKKHDVTQHHAHVIKWRLCLSYLGDIS